MTTLVKIGDNYGLCNRLFPFANLLACAIEHEFRLEHGAFSEFSDFFVGTMGQSIPCADYRPERIGLSEKDRNPSWYLLTRRVKRKVRLDQTISITSKQTFDLSGVAQLNRLRSSRTTQLVGLYFFDPLSFPKHEQSVRAYFRPVPELQQEVDSIESDCRAGSDMLVGVHIRHGDYATFSNGHMFYSVEEYAELMHSIVALHPGKRISFLVCTNGDVKPSDFGTLRTRLAPGHVVVDLYALARCDLIVGPSSTYSEWASFYGKVPRYKFSKNDYVRNGREWPGVVALDFEVHRNGFGRCALDDTGRAESCQTAQPGLGPGADLPSL
jgi:hypothetical protein